MSEAAFTDDERARRLVIGCHGCHATPRNDRMRPVWAIANALRERGVRTARAIRSVALVHGPANIDCGPHELVVLCLVRDGAMWIDAFIDHYRALGAKHLFFLDNGSGDDTVVRASRHRDVTVYATTLPFRVFEVGMRRWLARTLGWRRWALFPDVDELWDYPGSDRLPLPAFLHYLDARGYKAVAAHALDMFSDKPFSALSSAPGDDLRATYPFYDASDIVRTREMYWFRSGQVDSDAVDCTFGGVRQRFFGTECLCQTRHALHFADQTSRPYEYDGHFTAGARVADVTTVLLHYKFIGTLYQQATRNLELRNHPGASRNYRGFVDVLAARPDFCLHTPRARRLVHVDQLVDERFLVTSAAYRRWIDDYSGTAARPDVECRRADA